MGLNAVSVIPEYGPPDTQNQCPVYSMPSVIFANITLIREIMDQH